MKALLLNDLHFASKGPSTRVDDWHKTVNRKLDFIQATAALEKVDVIGIAGDIFHTPGIAYSFEGTYAPLEAVTKRLAQWARWWPICVIPGNHDLPNNRMDLIGQSSFGVLLAAGILRPVWEHPYIHVSDGSWLGGLPYPATEADIRNWGKTGPAGPGILLVHAYGSMIGGEQAGGDTIWAYPSLAQWAPNVVAFCFGHDHRDLGVETLGNQKFIQLGALMRGTRADDQITRQPKFAIVTTHGELPPLSALWVQPGQDTRPWCDVQVFEIPVEPANVVFDLTKTEQVATASDAIDAYVQELAMVTPVNGQAVALDNIAPDVRAYVERYLAKAAEGR